MSAALDSPPETALHAPPRRPLELRGLLAFLAVGGGAALAYLLLTTALISLNTPVPAWVLNTACYAAMVLPAYLLHRRFSFRSDAPHTQALPRYVAVQGMAIALAAIFSYLMHGVFSIPSFYASVLVIALTSGVNFMVLRSWAFARGHWKLGLSNDQSVRKEPAQ